MNVPIVIVGQQVNNFIVLCMIDYKAGQIIGESIGQQGYQQVEVFSVDMKKILQLVYIENVVYLTS